MDITPKTHLLVVSTDGSPLVENNSVLLQSMNDDSYVYVPVTTQIKELFGLTNAAVETVEAYDSEANYKSIECHGKAGCSDNQDQEVLEGNFYWDHKNTLLMLEEYRKRVSKFRNPKFKKKLLWDESASVMKQNGYLLSSDTVDKKMRNMKNTFRTILDNNNKKKTTGTGRMHWPYFKIFEDIFKEDTTINFASVMSTTKCSTENTVLSEINTISQLGENPLLSQCVDIIESGSVVSPLSTSVPLADATPKNIQNADSWIGGGSVSLRLKRRNFWKLKEFERQ